MNERANDQPSGSTDPGRLPPEQDRKYPRTIDWDAYWADVDENGLPARSASAEYVVDALLEFLDATGAPSSYADVGCGPGATAFAVADRYPDAAVVGYDAAEAVLAANREQSSEVGHSNVTFRQAVLPAFEPEREFDVVSCFFTLCYVRDVERALRALYDAVAPGGVLVFTYHNKFARTQFQQVADNPERYVDAASRFDPDTYADRFELVLDGESTLSYDAIHDTLGTWPQSVWSAVEDAQRYGASRMNPLVYVPKPHD